MGVGEGGRGGGGGITGRDQGLKAQTMVKTMDAGGGSLSVLLPDAAERGAGRGGGGLLAPRRGICDNGMYECSSCASLQKERLK